MYQKPKGTRDYFPVEKEVFNRIADSLRGTALSYGFREIESPAFESMNMLTAKQGKEIKQQIFTLEKRGDEEFGLRFELTGGFTRMFVSKQKEIPKPVKWFGIGRMWRYERPQSGRLREFYQFNAEVFGADRPEADAELISMAIDCLTSLGLTKKDFVVRINNRVLLQDFIKSLELNNYDEVYRAIDKKLKIPEETWEKELEKASLNKEDIRKLKNFLKIRDLDRIKIKSKGLENLKQVVALLNSRKDFIEIDFSTVRGLAYYTGTVFEIFDRKGKLRSIAGGGRYDNMIELFGGEKCSATGFAIGFATLTMLLEQRKLLPKPDMGVDYYIAPLGEKAMKTAKKLAEKIRKKASVEIDLMGRSLAKQLDYANKTGAKNAVIIGEEEIKKKVVKVKDMKTGKEVNVRINDL